MSVQPKRPYTPEEYIEMDRAADHKSEYLDGEIFAMGGASARHALIVLNVGAELRSQLRASPCTVYTTDLRVRVGYHGLYAYPDVVVVCGEPQFTDDALDTLVNPVLIVEVLSPSTKDYDRGEKFEQYRRIGGLQEYVLVAQDRPHVEHYIRQPDGSWLFTEAEGLDSRVDLPSIHCTLATGEIYVKVNFGVREEIS